MAHVAIQVDGLRLLHHQKVEVKILEDRGLGFSHPSLELLLFEDLTHVFAPFEIKLEE